MKTKSFMAGAARGGQRGAMIVLFTIAMVAMLGMVGMALDGAHGMLNKARLQNTVDAAALSAAKTLDQTATASSRLRMRPAILAFRFNTRTRCIRSCRAPRHRSTST